MQNTNFSVLFLATTMPLALGIILAVLVVALAVALVVSFVIKAKNEKELGSAEKRKNDIIIEARAEAEREDGYFKVYGKCYGKKA